MPSLNPFAARVPLPLGPAPAAAGLRNAELTAGLLPRSADSSEPGRCGCGIRPLAVRLRMRSGQRPGFQGNWHCGRACLSLSVNEVVRREFRNGHTSESRMRHRIPLGLLLQSRGVLTAEVLRQALAVQAETGGRLGDVLFRDFGIDESRIAAALAAQWNAPLWHLPAAPTPELLLLAPLALFRGSGALPIRLIGTRLSLASADSVDPAIALALERMHGIAVDSGIALASALDAHWSALSGGVPRALRSAEEIACDSAGTIAREIVRVIDSTGPVDSRAVRVGRRMWLRLWLEPAALLGGPCHPTDVLDYLFTLPAV